MLALRHLGTARTGAYFSVAPFAGALLALPLLGEAPTWPLQVSAALMGVGVWPHLTERHEHLHTHEILEHSHEHAEPTPPDVRHTHLHRHEALSHIHPHYPDAHHRHEH